MSSLREDLALERAAVAELDAQATAAWQARQYKLARTRQAEAKRARERVAELEAREFTDAHLIHVHVRMLDGEQ